jgi:hypothetical protein
LILAFASGCAGSQMSAPAPPADAVMRSDEMHAPEMHAPEMHAPAMQGAIDAPTPGGGPAPMVAHPPEIHTTAPAPIVSSSAGAKQVESRDADEALDGDAMLIFDGQVHMQVDAVAKSIDAVVDVAVAAGGYVAQQDDRSVTVRVPSKRFRDAMREMEAVGEVTHRGVQAADVSEEFHDLGVRLKSLMATRARLEQFLGRASNIEEVLRVEQELSRLNGEIDRIQGRMRFLEARASFSTITVSLEAKPEAPKKIVEAPPPPPAAQTIALPIDWLPSVGIEQLLRLR